MRNIVRSSVLVLSAASLLWCASFSGTGPLVVEAGVGDGNTSASDGGPGSTANPIVLDSAGCPIGRGPRMVRVTVPTGNYCIDQTEVTVEHYGVFVQEVATGASTPTFDPSCVGKTSVKPQGALAGSPSPAPGSEGGPGLPVVGVDWCDAYAFCAWAGKRLCGGLGADGGAVPFATPEDLSNREWGMACSNSGFDAYPYGNAFVPGTCNDGSRNPSGLTSVGSLAGCKTAAPNVFDLSGNVEEWENSCASTDPHAHCHRRGGSYLDGKDGGAGAVSFAVACGTGHEDGDRTLSDNDVGIRCCAN